MELSQYITMNVAQFGVWAKAKAVTTHRRR